ncbi:amidase domain-containing protein [Brevibacillus ruminantium]|uniref:Amidase domain-containing protein n=1 Tax=Brevibacillus ruminantium TaxID=2950604 RepID=A0ABY4WIV7_9BACL|nr:amidase domain-containing protein [Brevibacillus ruminantium]USG65284.1 amidase domain-containing protein [Brevibacillus ruminantium]
MLKKLVAAIVMTFLFTSVLAGSYTLKATEGVDEESSKQFLEKLYNARAKMLVDRNISALEPYYILEEKQGRAALGREKARMKYIQAWAKERGVAFTDVETRIRIARIKKVGDGFRVGLVQSLKLTYQYPTDGTLHSFGVGTRHGLTIKRQGGEWRVKQEWYLDPLDENPELIPVHKKPHVSGVISLPQQPVGKVSGKRKYNREKAVEYANKYAGTAFFAGNNNRYNPKYLDYTYQGGDCTNFTSQVIGDREEGGGLPMRGGWFYKYKQGGSAAWVRTDSLKHFLLSSGYGKLIARGNYNAVAKPTKKFPHSALAELRPGDLIGYEMGGDLDHFSVVTALDPKGYVLVNSHTADRYHVPWDLGWDKHTKFLLIRMVD